MRLATLMLTLLLMSSSDLCLFINDLYQTAQLWRPRDARWCKCK